MKKLKICLALTLCLGLGVVMFSGCGKKQPVDQPRVEDSVDENSDETSDEGNAADSVEWRQWVKDYEATLDEMIELSGKTDSKSIERLQEITTEFADIQSGNEEILANIPEEDVSEFISEMTRISEKLGKLY